MDDDRLVILTSGTTGRPSPVRVTTGQLVFSAFGSATRLGLRATDRWLCALPLHHIGGLSILYRSAFYGTSVELMPRFDAQQVADRIVAGGVCHVSLVPTMLTRVLDALGGRHPHSDLRVVLLGGAHAPDDLLDRAERAGIPVSTTWGMSEAASQVATAWPGASGRGGHVGPALPFAQITGRHPLTVEGPVVRGRLVTKDAGRLGRDGLHVDGRVDDGFISGGENVHPREIEACLTAHPEVSEAAVIAIADPEWGQRPVAVIGGSPGASPDALRTWCRARLSPAKVPLHFLPVDALPRTALGKPALATLAQWVAEALHTSLPSARSELS